MANFLKKVNGIKTSDGAGVSIYRIIGSHEFPQLDPFLLLDQFKNNDPKDYIAGFPPHPHRGFETVTYMIEGHFAHEDSRGNKGQLGPGSIQWMTAGKGIVHSEMPAQENGMVWGFQLWLNLPASKKMIEPSYQDISSDKIPLITTHQGQFKLISGNFLGQNGPGKAQTPFLYLDFSHGRNKIETLLIDLEKSFNQFKFENYSVMIYMISGQIADSSGSLLSEGQLGVLHGENQALELELKGSDQLVRFLLLAAPKLNEPIVRSGPFVMNTRAQIIEAYQDFEDGKMG